MFRRGSTRSSHNLVRGYGAQWNTTVQSDHAVENSLRALPVGISDEYWQNLVAIPSESRRNPVEIPVESRQNLGWNQG